MQSVSSRIWTRVAVSMSYDDNHYTTGTYIMKQNSFPSGLLCVCVLVLISSTLSKLIWSVKYTLLKFWDKTSIHHDLLWLLISHKTSDIIVEVSKFEL